MVVNPPSGDVQKTFMVLGVQRGGTSMVAGVLRALGIDMGPAGFNHEDRRFLTDDEISLSKLIDQRNNERDIWGFKSPQAALKLDFYRRNLRNPQYIVVFRNVSSTIDGVFNRGGLMPAKVLRRIVRYYQGISTHVLGSSDPTLFVSYERATADKENFVHSLSRFLEIEPTKGRFRDAMQVISTDGGGYVSLPSEYFHVEPLAATEDTPLATIHVSYPRELSIGGLTAKALVAGAPNLPRRFQVEIDTDAVPQDGQITFFFRFSAEFAALHRQVLKMTSRRAVFAIETNGTARAMAIASSGNSKLHIRL